MDPLAHFESFYSDFKSADMAQIGRLYATDVVFRDPVHELSGLVELATYFAASQSAVAECRFEFLDRIVGAADLMPLKCCYRWRMHYRHPRLQGGAQIELMGASVLHLEGKIVFHEDFYDMGAMLYEQVPLLGSVVRWLKNRVAGGSQ